MKGSKVALIQSVERNYAQVLLELAAEAHAEAAVRQELAELADLARHEPQLLDLLASRVLAQDERARILDHLFRGRVSELLLRFLHVLNRHERAGQLPQIARAYELLLEERLGEVEVEAWTAAPLPPALAQEMTQRIGAALQRQALLQPSIDPRLIGGLKIRVGDRLFDGSVATHLRLLRERMIEQGRARARQASGPAA